MRGAPSRSMTATTEFDRPEVDPDRATDRHRNSLCIASGSCAPCLLDVLEHLRGLDALLVMRERGLELRLSRA